MQISNYIEMYSVYKLPTSWVLYHLCDPTHGKTVTIHQLTTMLATSKSVQFPGHNHLLTIGTDDSLTLRR